MEAHVVVILIFVKVVLGHFVADFWLQPKRMALGKKEPGWTGFGWCLLHCAIYTTVVCLFLWNSHPAVIAIVFASHWPLDRYSLTNKWMKLIGGRTFEGAYLSKDKFREFDISFTCNVYTIADSTAHITLMWLALSQIEVVRNLF